jgi:glycosyltransferase involved in cell wall biosynthesis
MKQDLIGTKHAMRGEGADSRDACDRWTTPGAPTGVPTETAIAPIRLLLTITRCWPAVGGAEIHTRELLRALGAQVDPVVAAHWDTSRTDWLLGTTVRAPRDARQYEDEGRPVRLIGLGLGDRLFGLPAVAGFYPFQRWAVRNLAGRLVPSLREAMPRPSLIHNVRAGREPLTAASLAFARERGVPFVLTPNLHARWTGWLYRVYRDIYQEADALIAFTNHEREALVKLGAKRDRVRVTGIGPVVAPSADPDRARHAFNLPDRFVLFLGQKYAYKGLGAVLQAAPLVWRNHPRVHFAFVGPRTACSRHLFAQQTDPRIHEYDTVDIQEKTDLLSACEMLCVPSSQESFGGVIVEAWTQGRPVVVGPAPAAFDVVAEGEDGLLLPEATGHAVAERVVRLLDDPALADTMGQRGALKVVTRYSWDRLAEQTLAIYRSLL